MDSGFSTAALRGAVDLSSLAKKPATGSGGAAASNSTAGGAAGANAENGGQGLATTLEITDAEFEQVLAVSERIPLLLAVYSAARPDSAAFMDQLSSVVAEYQGRILLARINIDVAVQVRAMLQVSSVPLVIAAVRKQPIPLFEGAQPLEAVRQVIDQVLAAAAEAGVNEVLQGEADAGSQDDEEEQNEFHQAAFTAIEEGDLDRAVAAYTDALKANPDDEDAQLGRAQVQLMLRTRGVDLGKAREDAAADPGNVPAQILAADLDMVGGHVEDAFQRLIDTVKATTGKDRDSARSHLLQLFTVLGAQDPRVLAARRALMSALY